MYSTLKKIFSNPIINFVLATLVAFSLFLFSKNITEISYSVSKEEIIVSKSKGTPELTFHWKEQLVTQDLKRLKIVIWNSGNSYIDYLDISKTIKLQIKLSGNNSVMSQKISSISRKNLNVTTEFETDDKQFINIDFKGDDAIEVNDGFVISIFYVGEEAPKVEFLGRIKGIKGGFEFVDWNSIKPPIEGNDKKALFMLGFIFICGVSLIIPSLGFTVKGNWGEAYKHVSFTLGAMVLVLPMMFLFGLANVMFFGIPWAL